MADMASKSKKEENVVYYTAPSDWELKRSKERLLKILRLYEEDKKPKKAIPPQIRRRSVDGAFDYPDKEIKKASESVGVSHSNPIMDAIRADPEALAFHTQRRLELLKLKSHDHLQFNAVEDFGPITKINRIPRRPR